MRETSIYMIHDLQDLPNDKLPDGYQFRRFDFTRNDDATWAAMVTATGEFPNESEAFKRFEQEFRPYPAETAKRILFLETAEGQAVGTATAWFGEWNDETIGRLHWVEIIPDFQGKKLGKPLIAEAMNHLARFHQKVYLTTQESSLAAIYIYRKFGFRPLIHTTEQQQIWNRIFVSLANS